MTTPKIIHHFNTDLFPLSTLAGVVLSAIQRGATLHQSPSHGAHFILENEIYIVPASIMQHLIDNDLITFNSIS